MLKEYSLTVHGRKTVYWSNGKTDKPPIVFLHGFPGNHQGMLWLAHFFIEEYFVIMPDSPGCGQSDPLVKNHGIESHAEWLNGFLEVLAIKKTVIIGHSFGARVATYFAAYYSEKISATVLLTPVVRVEGFWGMLASRGHKLAKVMPGQWQKKYLSNTAYQHFAFWLTFKSDDKKKRDEIMHQSMAEVKKLDPKIHLEMLDDLYRHDIQKWGKKIVAPCLIIAGLRDDIVTMDSVESLSAKIKNVTLEIMENTGHLLPIEHPKFVAETIQSWLRNS